jgi:Ser/Thr protein kinase RdoA (MazF antagonist)
VTTEPPPRPDIPAAVLTAWPLDPASIDVLAGGHINRSFGAVHAAIGACVLQRVNPIFPPAVNDDIDAVTRHLRERGIVTPELVATRSGARCIEADGGVWRVLTRIAGETHELIADAAMAREAGHVLGRFHAAVADFAAPLASTRPPVHDLPRHLGNLKRTLAEHEAHAARDNVAEVATRIFALADAVGPWPALPARLVHGDPKISNVIFAGSRAVCLIDFDTIARMPAPLELGDALRSWCNTAAEDSSEARFSVARFRAALAGYRDGAGELLDTAEWQAIPAATLSIAVELAARFAGDALAESYFGWDRARFASASAHNLARAKAQLALAAGIREALPALRAVAVTRA